MKEIIVTIGKDASVSVETKGFSGPACLAATAALEAAIGGTKRVDTTNEYYEPEAQQEKAKA